MAPVSGLAASRWRRCLRPSAGAALVAWLALPVLAGGELNLAQDLNLCLVNHNNLGGKGPQPDAANIRYKDVAQDGMQPVDLLIVSDGEYRPQDVSVNGNTGEGRQIGSISVQAGSKVHLVFKFVVSATEKPVALDFYFTLFVTEPSERLTLKGSLKGFQKYCLSSDTILKGESTKDQQSISFVPSSDARSLLPRDPFTLHKAEKDQAVTTFFHASEFSVTVDFTGSSGSEKLRFMFSGTAGVQEACTTWEGGSGAHKAASSSTSSSSPAPATSTATTITTTTTTTATPVPTTTTWTSTSSHTSTTLTTGTSTTTTTRTVTTTTATTTTRTTATSTSTDTHTISTTTTTRTTSRTPTSTSSTTGTTSTTSTTTTWDKCRLTTTTTSRLYDCTKGFSIWESPWSHEKQEWCRRHEALKSDATETTTPDPFDCHEGFSNWVFSWSYEKRSWCCERCSRGCQLVPTTTRASVAPFNCGADGDPRSSDHEVERWSEEQRHWCCATHSRGCLPTTTATPADGAAATREKDQPRPAEGHNPDASMVVEKFDCQDGPQSDWQYQKKAWCCEHYSMGCLLATTSMSAPYDCTAGLANWRMGWSKQKQKWCCEIKTMGCAETTTTFLEAYDCQDQFLTWESDWPKKKKLWCCAHYNRGCEDGVGSASSRTTSPLYDCKAGLKHWEMGWSYRKKQWCCHNKHLGCAVESTSSEPYDCAAGYVNWQQAWTYPKRQYCCSQYNRGCESVLPQRKFENLRLRALVDIHPVPERVGMPTLFFVVAGGMCLTAAVAAMAALLRRGHVPQRVGPRKALSVELRADCSGCSYEEVAQNVPQG